MQTALNLATQAQTSLKKGQPQPGTTEPAYNDKLVSRLFVRFASMYGHLWKSQFKSGNHMDAAKAEWGRKLTAYDPMRIGEAIEKCFKVYPKPPTLVEFLMLCDGHAPCHKPYKALPKPEPDASLAKRSISEMRKILSQ